MMVFSGDNQTDANYSDHLPFPREDGVGVAHQKGLVSPKIHFDRHGNPLGGPKVVLGHQREQVRVTLDFLYNKNKII